MQTHMMTSVQVICQNGKCIWRAYDYNSDQFKRFLETPEELKYTVLLEGATFLVIGNASVAEVFLWQDGTLVKVAGNYKFSILLSSWSNCKIYQAINLQASFLLIFWKDGCYFAETLEKKKNGDLQALLADGRVMQIHELKQADDDPDYSHMYYTVGLEVSVPELKREFSNLVYAEKKCQK